MKNGVVSRSESVSQRYRSANPYPLQNVTDPEHWLRISITQMRIRIQLFSLGLRIRDVYPGSEFIHPGSRSKRHRIRIRNK
jgi:hypothetical protein